MLYKKILAVFFAYIITKKRKVNYLKKKSIFYPFIFLISAVFSFALIMFPKDIAEAVRNSLYLCANSVIPSLFPFFVVAKLITNMRFADIFGKVLNRIMLPLFSVSGTVSSALALGLIGGYPVGAMTCASLYSANLCSREEAERSLAFCNNCGPAFIIGAVGAGVFSSPKVGISLLLIHISAAITIGLLFRIVSPITKSKVSFSKHKETKIPEFSNAFTNAVSSALKSSLTISAYIVLFSVIVCAAKQLCLLPALSRFLSAFTGIKESIIESVISGILEMTVGIYSLAGCASFDTAFVLTAFLLGWGGLSVHCQALSALSDCGLNTGQYFMGKLFHGAISSIYAYAALNIFKIAAVPAFAPVVHNTLDLNPAIASALLIIFILIFCKKGWKKAK